ncbi:DNA alkylation repair protein [Nesterenkonia sp. NBAIMH1]|uniref:DNA alkylation repair protein n=1 Tax=Nesterenkonia sp. NBAIMH1 TaxID=2600320 RepID=UPI0011B44336|nr:DNA alkylation repair protein [Nesterenkonia sp. NBAIMH1]
MTDSTLKRHFTGDCARELAERILPVLPSFDAEGFVREVDEAVGPLELKDRVRVLAEGIRSRLPESYPEAVDVLVRSLGPELPDAEGTMSSAWFLMPVARFVEIYGLQHPETSLAALDAITRRHTAEYAIRPYLAGHQELTLQQVHRWTQSESFHVRRLASEGIRPRLSWASHHRPFKADPEPVLAVLTELIDDPSLYVRRSVANGLNDISKDNPARALSAAKQWLEQSPTDRTRWVVRHGLRSLIKAGDAGALALVDATPDRSVVVEALTVSPEVLRIGETLTIAAEVRNVSDERREAVVDYTVHFLGADGSLRPKVFKLKRVMLEPGARVTLTKRRSFRPVNARTLYPGPHAASVQANGQRTEQVTFVLEEA